MKFTRSMASVLVALLFGAAWGGCTAVVPQTDDVERCDNVEECPDIEDTRFVSECVGGSSAPGVCIANFAMDLRCDPAEYETYPDHPLVTAYENFGNPERYASDCAGDNVGARGCPGPCQSGLVENINGVCDQEGAFPPAVGTSMDLAGRDLRDQFCRSYFCDMAFYCDTSRTRSVCRPCVEGEAFSEGGCGDLYIGGERSCAYQDQAGLDNTCQAPDSDHETTTIGECPTG